VFAEPKGSTSICQGFRGWSVKKLKNNLVLCPCKVIQNHCFWCQSTAREWLRISDHISHDSASVVRATFKVYGKRQTLTLSQPKTSEPIVTIFEWTWTSPTNKNSLGLIRPWVFDPHIDEIYTPSSKLTTLFWFFNCLQASPLDRFLHLIRQMTRFCARKCFYIVTKLPK